MTPNPRKPYKAWAAALVTLFGQLWVSLQGVKDWSTLGFQDWATIVVPPVLAWFATYYVTNPDTAPVDPNADNPFGRH